MTIEAKPESRLNEAPIQLGGGSEDLGHMQPPTHPLIEARRAIPAGKKASALCFVVILLLSPVIYDLTAR